ncbi:MAG: sialate O-acetylesterase [Pirellulaceae bacterium]|jgi:sialate O-acetylesterase|nr:sialate O-acetylesterase [Pirellulaceae bacterium]
MKKLATVLLVLSACVTASADIRVPRLFSDNMIFQQQTRNVVWGFATPGEKVTVRASWGDDATTVTDESGDWKVMLKTPAHGTAHSLIISGQNTITIQNVAVGEVWLCAGQSNMGWALSNTFGGEEEAASANAPNFRIFKSAREHWHEPLKESRDRLAEWSPCHPESAAATSAVSYYFGKKLHDKLGIPVGIIVQAYAGTPIEGWMPKEIQDDDPRVIAEIEDIERRSRRYSKEEALKNFQEELKEYNAKIAAGETMKNRFRQLQPPFITKPASLGHQYPSHIFNAMIYPVRPYGIRGAIWYQGERNSKNVPQTLNYRKQLAKLIGYYRSSWHELSEGNVAKDFPFYFTQLPSWNPPQENPVEGLEAPWAVNREMMRLVTLEVPNTAMAVSIDTGDAIALHPQNKKPIGIRHAYLALKRTYGRDIVDSGPRFQEQTIKANRIVLKFDSVGSGLMSAKSGKLDSFAIASEDMKWHWAEATIEGNTVVVSSPQVVQPVAARYAWAMNPSQRNLLYNKEGFPAPPFRTDGWPLFDSGNGEIVEVNKPKKPEGYQPTDWERPVMIGTLSAQAEDTKIRLFDMAAIRDSSTLEVEVIQDWHRVGGDVPTRQTLVTINVGEIWPGQGYRIPVRMVVPADRKAKGFHLTGGNSPERLRQDTRLAPIDQQLIEGGVGLVYTVVQVLERSGLGELGKASEARFLKTLNPHDKIQYWAWPATMMRAITTANAESDHFEVGKVAMSGGSKNGATPSMAILHDDRMTAVHASVSPIWESPLRLCDRQAWDELEADTGPLNHAFLGGHFGPIYNEAALASGHRWEDLQKLANDISDSVFITRNIEALRARNVDLLFHPGTHDFVAYDLAWGGEHHPTIPVYLRANSGHGKKKQHPAAERNQQNKAAFLLEHFFDSVDPLLEPPTAQYELERDKLNVTVRFKRNSGEESGRMFFIYDRAPDGSPGYLQKLIPDENWVDMKHDRQRDVWTATIDLDPNATRVDFFSNHRKTIHYQGKGYATYISCPYTRVELLSK